MLLPSPGPATLKAIAAALAADALHVTGQRVPVAIRAGEVERAYAPLAVALRDLALDRTRALVAIAGPPGSGKSVLATLLARAVAALDLEGCVRPVGLGLDGFHYPNDVLSSRCIEIAGETVPLKLYKGAEFTFDAAAAQAKFDEIRRGFGKTVRAPAYDRGLHEPVADAVAVPGGCRLVIVEGNYLLLDEGDWKGMADLFDLRIYIDMSLEDCKPGLLARHCRGGRDPRDAEQHYQRVDVPNYRVIEATQPRADWVVRKAAGHRIVELTPRRQGAKRTP